MHHNRRREVVYTRCRSVLYEDPRATYQQIATAVGFETTPEDIQALIERGDAVLGRPPIRRVLERRR